MSYRCIKRYRWKRCPEAQCAAADAFRQNLSFGDSGRLLARQLLFGGFHGVGTCFGGTLLAVQASIKSRSSPAAARRVLQVVDLCVNLVEIKVEPLWVDCLRLRNKRRYVTFFADDDFQNPVINGRRAEEGVVEIASGDPFAVDAHLAGGDPPRTPFDGGDVDRGGAIDEAVLLYLDERIDGSKKVVQRA
jgi:hypothetical protein